MDSTNKSTQFYSFEEIAELGFDQDTVVHEELAIEDYFITEQQVFEEMAPHPQITNQIAASEVKTKGTELANNSFCQKSDLLLHQRMKNWVIRKDKRIRNDRIDTVYIHQDSYLQLRSMYEVDDYVQSGLHPKRLTKKRKFEEEKGVIESSSKKKTSHRAKVDWIFDTTRILEGGNIIHCDIKFRDPRHFMNRCSQDPGAEF